MISQVRQIWLGGVARRPDPCRVSRPAKIEYTIFRDIIC